MEVLAPYFDEDDGERIFDTPALEVETKIGKIVLTHLNCRIRVFKNTMANHVEFRDDDDRLRAFVPTAELMDTLFEMEFPMLSLPYVDQATGNWLRVNEAKMLEGGIDGML